MSHHSSVYWCLTVLLTSAHRGVSVRGISSFSIISPISTNLQTETHLLKNTVQVHRGGPYTNTLKPSQHRHTHHIQTHIYTCQAKLQGLKEEVGQYKHLHFLSTPLLISFHPSLSCFFFLLDFSNSCWHSCKSVRLDSHFDYPHLYVGVCLSKW